MEEWSGDRRGLLVILDDLMNETDERVTQLLFSKGSHHRNLSVVIIVQNLFGKNKEHQTISLNTHYLDLVIFKNTRDASQITSTHMAKQMHPGKLKYVQESFKDATSSAHGYLLVDLCQDTPDYLRLRSNIPPPPPPPLSLNTLKGHVRLTSA